VPRATVRARFGPLDHPLSSGHAHTEAPPSVHWSLAGALASPIKACRPFAPEHRHLPVRWTAPSHHRSTTACPPLCRLPSPVGISSGSSGTYPGSHSRVSSRARSTIAGRQATAAGLGRHCRAPSPAAPFPRPKPQAGPGAPLDHPTPVPGRPRRRTSSEFHSPHRPPPQRTSLQGERTAQGPNRKIRAYL
jgi:hypothetical protein